MLKKTALIAFILAVFLIPLSLANCLSESQKEEIQKMESATNASLRPILEYFCQRDDTYRELISANINEKTSELNSRLNQSSVKLEEDLKEYIDNNLKEFNELAKILKEFKDIEVEEKKLTKKMKALNEKLDKLETKKMNRNNFEGEMTSFRNEVNAEILRKNLKEQQSPITNMWLVFIPAVALCYIGYVFYERKIKGKGGSLTNPQEKRLVEQFKKFGKKE